MIILLSNSSPNAPLSKFRFTKGKTHRLRLINAGAEGIQRFSIDNHVLTVIANDFVPVTPYTTEVVTLGVSRGLSEARAFFNVFLRLVSEQTYS